MRLIDHLLSDELNRILSRMWLRDVRVDSLDLGVILVPEDRHVREHRQRVKRWRRRFGRENMHVADADPGLFREWRIEITVDALENSPRSAAEAWVGLVAALSERSGSSFA